MGALTSRLVRSVNYMRFARAWLLMCAVIGLAACYPLCSLFQLPGKFSGFVCAFT